MPVFETTGAVVVHVSVPVAVLRITASDRADAQVEVRPSRPSRAADQRAVERTSVSFVDGVLSITAPKVGIFSFRNESVDIDIAVPTGSRLEAENSVGDLTTTGVLGDCRFKSAVSAIAMEHTGDLSLSVSSGHVTIGTATGDARIKSSSGAIRVGRVDGSLDIKSSNGHLEVGEVGGDTTLRSANGHIEVGSAGASLIAKTANGAIRVRSVARGTVRLESATGAIDLGVRNGTAAWLDARSSSGTVHNLLTASEGPEASEDTVEVVARTSYGDITVRRAAGTTTRKELT